LNNHSNFCYTLWWCIFNADFIKDFLLENFHLLEENQQTNDCLNQRVLCRRILFDFHHGGLCLADDICGFNCKIRFGCRILSQIRFTISTFRRYLYSYRSTHFIFYFSHMAVTNYFFLHSKQRWCLEWKHMIIFPYQCCHPRRLSQLKIRKFISRLRFWLWCMFIYDMAF
jgi:hypothetical protein